MVALFGSPQDYRMQIYLGISFSTCVIGLFASILTVLVIRKLYPITSHVYLILCMTIYQGIYNIFFFFMEGSAGSRMKVLAMFFTLVCGVASSVLSNWIAYAVFSTIFYRKKFDVFKHLPMVHLSAALPGLVLAIVYVYASVPESDPDTSLQFVVARYAYNVIRSASIWINVVFIATTAYLISRIYGKSIKNLTSADVAIVTLCRRMIFYPFIQAVGRSGCAWYEAVYGLDYNPEKPSNPQFASLLYMAIAMPLVSVGYLLVFLWMQPNAWRHLKMLLNCTSEVDSSIACEPNSIDIPKDSSLSESSAIRGQRSDYISDVHLEQELSVAHSVDVSLSHCEQGGEPHSMHPSAASRQASSVYRAESIATAAAVDNPILQ